MSDPLTELNELLAETPDNRAAAGLGPLPDNACSLCGAVPRSEGKELDAEFKEHLTLLRRAKYPACQPPAIPNIHVRLALRALLNKFDELMAYSGKREEMLEWLRDEANGLWADWGGKQELRDEAHRKLEAVREFLDYMETRGDGCDEFDNRATTATPSEPSHDVRE